MKQVEIGCVGRRGCRGNMNKRRMDVIVTLSAEGMGAERLDNG